MTSPLATATLWWWWWWGWSVAVVLGALRKYCWGLHAPGWVTKNNLIMNTNFRSFPLVGEEFGAKVAEVVKKLLGGRAPRVDEICL